MKAKKETEPRTAEQLKQDRQAIRMLVRAREDFQDMRKRMDNRLGRKADGELQDLANADGRALDADDALMFGGVSDAAHQQEAAIEKQLKKVLKRFPIYNEFLSKVKGIGTISAGWIVGEYDIHRATTVSKMWQFTGLNPGMVPGKKRVEDGEGEAHYELTGHMIRGDKLTPGHIAPFNKRLRVALLGVMCDGFIKCQNEYAAKYYYPMKTRLESSDNMVLEISKAGAKPKEIEWKEAKKAHRHRAAMRYMLKMFLKDLYVAWRKIEGLEVREPYAAEYLGKRHAG
jgi:hypothetical protein